MSDTTYMLGSSLTLDVILIRHILVAVSGAFMKDRTTNQAGCTTYNVHGNHYNSPSNVKFSPGDAHRHPMWYMALSQANYISP